jgi:HK97 family phage major capsid protein
MADPDVRFKPSLASTSITADGLIDLYHSVLPFYRARGVWMMNSQTLSAVRKLKDGDGEYLVSLAGINNAPSTMLLGAEIVEAVDMPDIAANSYPVVFGDFLSGYQIYDRVAMSILRDPFSLATSGQIRFHGRRRVAGGTRKAEALAKLRIAAS